jgi:hypothetical protein
MDKIGVYKGRVTKRSDGSFAQYGEKDNGNLELLIDVAIKFDDGVRVRTIPQYINGNTLEYVITRLRTCGWKGEDISDLTGVDEKDVDIEVSIETATEIKSRYPAYTGGDRNKYNILTRDAGRFTIDKPTDAKMFNAKFQALRGAGGGGNGGVKAPF